MANEAAYAAWHSFTRRHNARHKLWSHLFGGRYKAVLVDAEDALYLPTLIDYVHLNPVRAGLVRVEEGLETFAWSSLAACYVLTLFKRKPWVQAERGLRARGFQDQAAGRRRYLEHLERRAKLEGKEAGRGMPGEQSLQSTLQRGWFFGSQVFKEKLLQLAEQALKASTKRSNQRPGDEVKEHSEQRAKALIEAGMSVCKLTPALLEALPFGNERKVLVALAVKRETTVPLTWIAEQLRMSTRSTVSRETTTLMKTLSKDRKKTKLYAAILSKAV